MAKDHTPAAQQFSMWLSEACRYAREQAGANRELVAGYADVVGATIKRFEEQGAGTAAGQARIVAAYARACNIEDGRELYKAALDRWLEYTVPLTLEVLDASTADAASALPPRPRLRSESEDDVHES